MTLGDLIAALRDTGAYLYLDAGLRLRYVGPKLAPNDPIRPTLAEHRDELIRRLTPAPSVAPADAAPNPGLLMTLGARYGYPRLPLKSGEAIGEGYAAWRAFARTDTLWAAVGAARANWPGDPMIEHLSYREPSGESAAPAAVVAPAGPFTPSSEWQIVPDGYPCPPGAEFRMDLATGVNWGRWPAREEVPS